MSPAPLSPKNQKLFSKALTEIFVSIFDPSRSKIKTNGVWRVDAAPLKIPPFFLLEGLLPDGEGPQEEDAESLRIAHGLGGHGRGIFSPVEPPPTDLFLGVVVQLPEELYDLRAEVIDAVVLDPVKGLDLGPRDQPGLVVVEVIEPLTRLHVGDELLPDRELEGREQPLLLPVEGPRDGRDQVANDLAQPTDGVRGRGGEGAGGGNGL